MGTFCCSPALQSSTPRGQCNAGSGWVGSCATTIKRRRDRQPNSVQFNSNCDFVAVIERMRKPRKSIRYPLSTTPAPVRLRRSPRGTFLGRSNFLTTGASAGVVSATPAEYSRCISESRHGRRPRPSTKVGRAVLSSQAFEKARPTPDFLIAPRRKAPTAWGLNFSVHKRAWAK